MLFYVYTCPECGLQVRTDHVAEALAEAKVCFCESPPDESVEGEE